MKAKEINANNVLQLRGRIGKSNPLHGELTGVAPKVAFKMLTELAMEGVSARWSAARYVPSDHPMGETLRGMRSHEALIYLIGVTNNRPSVVMSGTRDEPAITAKMSQDAPLSLRVLNTPEAPAAVTRAGDSIEAPLDGDDLDAVLLFPSSHESLSLQH